MKQSEWISVADKLPQDDNNVLAYHAKMGIIFAWYNEEWQDSDHYYSEELVTHWQPLPECPL